MKKYHFFQNNQAQLQSIRDIREVHHILVGDYTDHKKLDVLLKYSDISYEIAKKVDKQSQQIYPLTNEFKMELAQFSFNKTKTPEQLVNAEQKINSVLFK